MTTRFITLRRPPVLQPDAQPFVPPGAVAARVEIDSRWAALCDANPKYFDGRLTHVIGVHRNGYGGAVLHVADCAYRYHAVQDDDFDLGVRPLGVKGICIRDGCVLMGRRSHDVANYGGLWEFAPGGVVEPGMTPHDTVVAELREETGYETLTRPTPLAILFDPILRCWEIVFRIELDPGQATPETAEYDDLVWAEPSEWPGSLTPCARQMVMLVESVVKAAGEADRI